MNIKNNVEILKLDDYARGIGYIDNKIVFVKDALPNEIVDVLIEKETKKYYEGIVHKYIKTSSDRIKPLCPYYSECGGCSIEHVTYEYQIEFKCNKLKNILKKFANIDTNIQIVRNDLIFNYRNKIELKIENNEWGYYNNKSHKFIKINTCLLASVSINNVIKLKDNFDIKNGEIIIRSNSSDEIIISIKTKDKYKINIDKLKNNIKLIGLIVNDKVIYGTSYFIESINDKKFIVNYNSFFQVNLNVAKKMIDIIKDNKNGGVLLDLYCGVGFLGQCLSDNFNKIYGIEINKNSIKDAIENSKINNINNTYYLCGDSKEVLKDITDNIDTLIIDPPRSGLYQNMYSDIKKINALNLIYISCNPVSLARDLNKLKEYYNIKNIYLLDMFSNTYHVESLVVLERR